MTIDTSAMPKSLNIPADSCSRQHQEGPCQEGRRQELCLVCLSFLPSWSITRTNYESNDYMKVQLAKLKAEQEKTGKKADHKVSSFALTGDAVQQRHRASLAGRELTSVIGELQEGRSDVGHCVSPLSYVLCLNSADYPSPENPVCHIATMTQGRVLADARVEEQEVNWIGDSSPAHPSSSSFVRLLISPFYTSPMLRYAVRGTRSVRRRPGQPCTLAPVLPVIVVMVNVRPVPAACI